MRGCSGQWKERMSGRRKERDAVFGGERERGRESMGIETQRM